MSEKNQPIIMFDSPDAASLKTVTGWVSRDGFFYGSDEQTARYIGCTHRPCQKCGKPTEKLYLSCPDCRAQAEVDKWLNAPRATWNGTDCLYSESEDRWFAGASDLLEFLGDTENYRRPCELQLWICTPNFPRLLDEDHFYDELPEDGEIPAALEAAIEAFNAALKDYGTPLSWSPGKFVPEFDENGNVKVCEKGGET